MTYEPVYTRTPRNAFVPSPVFVGIVAIFAVSGVLTWTRYGNVGFDVFLFVISGWLISLCLHEYAHAVAAYFSGDLTVAERGYLRLNPLKYTHPLLSIVLPVIVVILGGIGLPGGAVWVDHRYITSKVKDSLISAAGPLTNIVLAVVAAVPFLFGLGPEVVDTGARLVIYTAHPEFWQALSVVAFLQITASVLNLLPIPGLDGGSILRPWLSPAYRRAWDMFAPFGFLLLFVALWQTDLGGYFSELVVWLAEHLGLDRYLIADGFELMRFWSD
ncbi:site-2 protease family protein [Actinoplanes teichomyceticus]|uniref:Zn-dependent protease n=1 Tax=Actinoplanes teichomyceticus TaxID=1867 RepID=A0A561WIN0_ACTTI|nr:site-2 protease family protein [Actinoplanes teichomyceticus]TWG23737.1 Zn-dependent protease [Actinoplanes teichomyceticus]GIF11778.1 site-2 protease family protein [Actinoplanes teichomyceticus]